MKYTGELYFSDDDIIKVQEFIVRSHSEFAYSFVASWDGQGMWIKRGVALLAGLNYVSDEDPAICVETGEEGPPCKLTFSKVETDGDYLAVKGVWNERGVSYSFEGELEAKS